MIHLSKAFILISASAGIKNDPELISWDDNCTTCLLSIKFPSTSYVTIENPERYDKIVAIGGGTIMDTAKLLGVETGLPVICIPTIPGTGAETTGFAVCYEGKIKKSVPCKVPTSILIPELAESVPIFVLTTTTFDAIAQCIESLWSSNSDEESDEYAVKGLEHLKKVISKKFYPTDKILYHAYVGANYSGRAINISKTTAPHAMSYYLTAEHDYPHGIAVAASFMFWYDKCIQYVGDHLLSALPSREELISLTESLFPKDNYKNIDFDKWAESVNPERMANSPIIFEDSKSLAEALKRYYL